VERGGQASEVFVARVAVMTPGAPVDRIRGGSAAGSAAACRVVRIARSSRIRAPEASSRWVRIRTWSYGSNICRYLL
jgi:hypothetical protein